MFFTLHANCAVFVFSSQTADIFISDNDRLQISKSPRVQCLSGPETDPGKRPRRTGRSFHPTSLFSFFFNVLLIPLFSLNFTTARVVRDKAAVSDHEARSKYRRCPGSRACARTCVSSNTPPRLWLTRENRLCVNTDSDLDLRREGEEERWMEIWKKGRWQRERERGVVQKERVGWFLWLGQQKGNREAEFDI